MKEPISMKEILAIIIKSGKILVLLAVVGAILGGFVQYSSELTSMQNPETKTESIDTEMQQKTIDYEKEIETLQSTIASAEYKILVQEKYNEESLLMKLNSYKKYSSQVVLAITDVDGAASQQAAQQEGSPADYITTKIQNMYILFWNNVSSAEVFKDTAYANIDEKYIEEILTIYRTEGGTLSITAYGPTEEEAQMITDTVWKYLESIELSVGDATYSHDLTLLGCFNKVLIDQDLYAVQEKNKAAILEQKAIIEDCEKQIELLKENMKDETSEPATSVNSEPTTSVDLFAGVCLGAVVGILLGCILAWGRYIVSDTMETSRQIEALLVIPYLGSVTGKEGLWNRLAGRFIGERLWSDEEIATKYICENLKRRIGVKKEIAIISTLLLREEDKRIQLLIRTIQELGCNVCYVNSAELNPQTIVALCDCDVVFAERVSKSKRQAVLGVKDLARQFNASVLGFVLV